MIIKEYRCLDCGAQFESSDSDPACPTCSGDEAERAFFTAPGFVSQNTTTKDDIVKSLAADYGLTNMTNAGGAAVKQAPTGPEAPTFAAPNPQITQVLSKLGGNADGFSGVLPQLRAAGRPHQWAKVREKR